MVVWRGGEGVFVFGEEARGKGEALEVGADTDVPVYVVFEDKGCG